MQFYEKLIFLFNLTQVTNRMLATELKVDPSLISRLRTGTRGIPRNKEQIKAMSSFFAKRCTTQYQRQALSGMLGIRQALTMKKDLLTEVLYYWLCGETDEVGRFIRTFETLSIEDGDAPPLAETATARAENRAFYGNDGKRAAARAVYQHLLTLKKSYTIYLFSDEDDSWISEDFEFSGSLQKWGLTLCHRGFRFCHIAPPTSQVNMAFDSLLRWLPIYLTRRVTTYVYPRIRDSVHRCTLLVVPGEIAMTSASIAHQPSGGATIITTDNRLTHTYASQFQDYLSLCRPMQNIYTTSEKLMQCFARFLSLNGARIQKVISLSAETAPPEIMTYCIDHIEQPKLKRLGSMYLEEFHLIEESWKKHDFIDIACLASAEDVRSGKVPIILSYGEGPPLYYTPEIYVMHLKNILRILENFENYHFIPIDPRVDKEGTLIVKDGQLALLVRTAQPLTVFEIFQPEIVNLCQEHLLKIADRAGYTGVFRAKVKSQIKERIRELLT